MCTWIDCRVYFNIVECHLKSQWLVKYKTSLFLKWSKSFSSNSITENFRKSFSYGDSTSSQNSKDSIMQCNSYKIIYCKVILGLYINSKLVEIFWSVAYSFPFSIFNSELQLSVKLTIYQGSRASSSGTNAYGATKISITITHTCARHKLFRVVGTTSTRYHKDVSKVFNLWWIMPWYTSLVIYNILMLIR